MLQHETHPGGEAGGGRGAHHDQHVVERLQVPVLPQQPPHDAHSLLKLNHIINHSILSLIHHRVSLKKVGIVCRGLFKVFRGLRSNKFSTLTL